jgi:hypothetical protein
MKVECTLKEYHTISDSVAIPRELKVESTESYYPSKTVRLIIDNKEIVVNPDELIKAVENCVNC